MRHLLAGQRIERAERLVHQQDVGIVHQRAADCQRAAACRPTVRAATCPRSRRDRPASAGRARGRRCRASTRFIMPSGNSTLSRTLAHGSSVGAWKTMPVSARGSVTCCAADRRRVPGVGGIRPRDEPQQRRLPAARRPDQADELVAADRQRNVAQRDDLDRRRAMTKMLRPSISIEVDRSLHELAYSRRRHAQKWASATQWQRIALGPVRGMTTRPAMSTACLESTSGRAPALRRWPPR